MALLCQPEGSQDTYQVPIQGITKAELMQFTGREQWYRHSLIEIVPIVVEK